MWIASIRALLDSHSISSMFHCTLLDPKLFPRFSTFFLAPTPNPMSQKGAGNPFHYLEVVTGTEKPFATRRRNSSLFTIFTLDDCYADRSIELESHFSFDMLLRNPHLSLSRSQSPSYYGFEVVIEKMTEHKNGALYYRRFVAVILTLEDVRIICGCVIGMKEATKQISLVSEL